jgi:hypothetical protein
MRHVSRVLPSNRYHIFEQCHIDQAAFNCFLEYSCLNLIVQSHDCSHNGSCPKSKLLRILCMHFTCSSACKPVPFSAAFVHDQSCCRHLFCVSLKALLRKQTGMSRACLSAKDHMSATSCKHGCPYFFSQYAVGRKIGKQKADCSRIQHECFEQSVDDRALFEVPQFNQCQHFNCQVSVFRFNPKAENCLKVDQKHKLAMLPRHNLGLQLK